MKHPFNTIGIEKFRSVATEPEEIYQPRSFREKLDWESLTYFAVLGVMMIVLFAFIIHGAFIILTQDVANAVLFQLFSGVVALALCLTWVIWKFFLEVERINDST